MSQAGFASFFPLFAHVVRAGQGHDLELASSSSLSTWPPTILAFSFQQAFPSRGCCGGLFGLDDFVGYLVGLLLLRVDGIVMDTFLC